MDLQVSGDELIKNLDLAADVFLCPTSSEEERKRAEQYFLNLRSAKLSFDVSRFILENSTKEFVLFEIISTLKETIIREWPFVDQAAIAGICDYLLSFVTRSGLSNYVVSQILQAIAIIVKRGTFDKKSGDSGRLFDLAAQWIASGDANLQSLACQLLLSVCNEYCTSWRFGASGLTWDFHIRAKRLFEAIDLRRVFELCLQILHHLLNNVTSLCDKNGAYSVLTARLLFVAECVLNWNFGSKVLPKRITCSIEFSPAVCFKPGETWRQLLLEANVVQFFFVLYSRVKSNEELGHHVLQCLIQLASLTGSVFADDIAKTPYLHCFVGCITEMLKNVDQQVQPVALSQMILKLFSFFAIDLFFALPEKMVDEFLTLLTQLTCRYGFEAVKESGDDCESVYEEAYEKLLAVWTNLLSGTVNSRHLEVPCKEIFVAYVHSHVAPPSGTRPLVIAIDRREITEVVEDDRDRYADMLKNIGKIGRRNTAGACGQLYNLLKERVNAFCRYMAQLDPQQRNGVGGIDTTALITYQEDMHWLLLIAGSVLVLGEEDSFGQEKSQIPSEIYESSTRCGRENCSLVEQYMNSCILSPAVDAPCPESDRDNVIRLIGITLRWAAVESQAFSDEQGREFLSPQVAQTTLWCLKRLVAAHYIKTIADQCKQFPLLSQEMGMPSATLTNFVLEKSLKILTKWNGEVQLSKDAVALLTALVENQKRANEISDGANLFSELHKVNVQQLSPLARCGLLKCIVAIGATTELRTVQDGICTTILAPLIENFKNLLQNPEFSTSLFAKESVQTMLLDWFDCFSGIAQSTAPHTAQTLFAYLTPVLDASPSLLCVFKNYQPIVDAVLQFYVDVTRKMAVSLENRDSCAKLYACLLALLNAYSANNTQKYTTSNTVLEEEKMSDLLLLLQILTNILSKDIFINVQATGDPEAFSAANVTSFALDIVTPLMTNEFLQYPSLCVQYFKLVAHFFEMYPEKACRMNGKTLESLLMFIMRGLTGEYGNEVIKLSLDALNALGTFVAQCTSDYCIPVREYLWRFIRPCFESCLNTSGEVDLLNDSATTLYSVICCAQAEYNAMVQKLISSHGDPLVQEKLASAFRSLLPSDVLAQPLRREKRAFRDRFESFLNEVQGLLCLE